MRLGAEGGSGPRIAAGSTPVFPVLAHTFVYQELLGMRAIEGARIRLFHSRTGDPADLQPAFAALADATERIPPAIEAHRADLRWYRRTRPERVRSLFEALSAESGRPETQLEDDFDLLIAFSYARRQLAWRADYVHTWFFYNEALCGLVSSWLNDIPRGLTAYADHMLQDWPLKVVPLHLRTAAVIVATSQRVRRELLAIGGADLADRILVKPNGVDGTRFRFLAHPAAVGRPFEIVCVARIEPKKGLLHLVEAAKVLGDRRRDVRVHLVGAPDPESATGREHAAEIARRIAGLGLQDVVVSHGRMLQEELQPLLARVDACVMPSVETESGDKDGIPTALLEAMASGLPIVATDAGSIREAIEDGREGLLVSQRDPVRLADAIERLIGDPDLASRLGHAAAERFAREFDVRVTEPRLHERIRAAIAASRTRRPR